MTASKAVRKLLGRPMQLGPILAVGSIDRFLPVRMGGFTAVTGTIILEWTTSLDTSSRTLFVRMWGCVSTSRRTSSYVITSDCY